MKLMKDFFQLSLFLTDLLKEKMAIASTKKMIGFL